MPLQTLSKSLLKRVGISKPLSKNENPIDSKVKSVHCSFRMTRQKNFSINADLKYLLLVYYLWLLPICSYARESIDPPCTIGNFALPPSQQPGPLLSFGENIIDQGQMQVFLFADAYLGQNKHAIDLIPGILYGITDDLSVFFNLPIAPSYQNGHYHSSGLEDLSVQFEYALYTRISSCSSDQLTFVANLSFPTGSSIKNPPTGCGAVTCFVGATYNHTWTHWFCFTSYGAQLPLSHQGTHFGNQYLYQFGFGRNMTNIGGWILAWMIEIDGTFSAHNRIKGFLDPNSGGNVIYITPSLWASSTNWILQLGCGYPIQQHLFGCQTSTSSLVTLNLGRTF